MYGEKLCHIVSKKTIRLWSFNHPYWALRPWFSNAFKCVLNFNYVQRPLLFRKVFRRVLICFAELKLESNKKASGTYLRAIKGESEQWNQSCDHRVITQSSLPTLYFNNQGRERSACPSLQTLEVQVETVSFDQNNFISCQSRMMNMGTFFFFFLIALSIRQIIPSTRWWLLNKLPL